MEFMNGALFDWTNQIETSTLEARAHVVAITNHCKAETLGTAVMVIIKRPWLINDALTKEYTLEVR